MPYVTQYVVPDVFLEYKGVIVYHTYREGEYNDPSNNFFCTNVEDADGNDNGTQFDVRELPGFDLKQPPFLTGENDTAENKAKWEQYRLDEVEKKEMLRTIKLAIDNKSLKSSSPIKQRKSKK